MIMTEPRQRTNITSSQRKASRTGYQLKPPRPTLVLLSMIAETIGSQPRGPNTTKKTTDPIN